MRGNIFVKFSPTRGVYLYTQKLGLELPKIVQSALKRARSAWGDTQTLSHVIYSELVQRNLLDSSGFGISPVMGDNDVMLIVVDDANQQVGAFFESGRLYRSMGYEEFAALPASRLTSREFYGDSDPAHEDRFVPETPELYQFVNPVAR